MGTSATCQPDLNVAQIKSYDGCSGPIQVEYTKTKVNIWLEFGDMSC